ncbi:hypothetical protein Tco_1213534 [Tanacetum coccineum]
MSRLWRRQKVDAFTRRISDFSEDKKRRMPANVKTYDGTVGNARNWFSKLPRRSIDGFEELRRVFRLNFTQRKKCANNPVELARVKQRLRGVHQALLDENERTYSRRSAEFLRTAKKATQTTGHGEQFKSDNPMTEKVPTSQAPPYATLQRANAWGTDTVSIIASKGSYYHMSALPNCAAN